MFAVIPHTAQLAVVDVCLGFLTFLLISFNTGLVGEKGVRERGSIGVPV